jgi:hypothetical protein
MEIFLDLAFLIFALGFFTISMRMVMRDHREAYDQRLMEAREFGFGGKNQHNVETLHDK